MLGEVSQSERVDLKPYINSVDWISSVRISGRVTELIGLLIKATVPGARVGEVCLIRSPKRALVLRAEVVGFRGSEVILMPLGEVSDIAMGAEVVPTGSSLSIRVGDELLGRVLDGLGQPLDRNLNTDNLAEVQVSRRPPDPMKRARVTKMLETGNPVDRRAAYRRRRPAPWDLFCGRRGKVQSARNARETYRSGRNRCGSYRRTRA